MTSIKTFSFILTILKVFKRLSSPLRANEETSSGGYWYGLRALTCISGTKFSCSARLAQSAERKALNLVVVGSSPTSGAIRTSRYSFSKPKRYFFLHFLLRIGRGPSFFLSLLQGEGHIPSEHHSLYRNGSSSLCSPRTSNTVGLVVEYTPATGETRVRFSDGVASATNREASLLCNVLFLSFWHFGPPGALFVHPPGGPSSQELGSW